MKLRIKDWDRCFENYKSRERDNCAFLCLPNKMGEGRRYLLGTPDGLAAMGLFLNLAESCSTHTKPRSGLCTSGGKKTDRWWDLEDISAWYCRGDKSLAKSLIDILCSNKVSWLEDLDAPAAHPTEYPSSTRQVHRNERKNERRKEGKNERTKECALRALSSTGVDASEFPDGFAQFWTLYPRRGRERSSRAKCLKAWSKQSLEPKAQEIIAALHRWIDSESWSEENGRFIVGADRWLRDEKFLISPTPRMDDHAAREDEPFGTPYEPTDDELAKLMGGNS